MTKKLLFVVAIMCVMTFAVMAADIDGKWTSEQAGRGGGAPRVTTYTFHADGAKLTGTVLAAAGRGGDPVETKIEAGKIEGKTVSFKVTRDMGGSPYTTEYMGTLDGSTISFKVTSPGRNGGDPQVRDVVAKRATT